MTQTRAEQKKQTRIKLINSATHIISNHGVSGTKTLDVAKHAGMSHGGLFVHFPSRAEMLTEVVKNIGEKITDKLYFFVSKNVGFRDVLQWHIECIKEFEAPYTALLRESHLFEMQVLKDWVSVHTEVSSFITGSAKKEMSTGSIREMPLYMLFNTWQGLVHYYLLNNNLFAPQGSVLKKHGSDIVNHFLLMVASE